MQKQKGKHANEFDFVGLGADFLTGLTPKISVEPLDQRNHKGVVPIHSIMANCSKTKRNLHLAPDKSGLESFTFGAAASWVRRKAPACGNFSKAKRAPKAFGVSDHVINAQVAARRGARRSAAVSAGPVAAGGGAEAVENILWRGFANLLRL